MGVRMMVDDLHKRQEKDLCRARQRLAFVRGTRDRAAGTATHIIADLDYDLLVMVCAAVQLPTYTLARATARAATIVESVPPEPEPEQEQPE